MIQGRSCSNVVLYKFSSLRYLNPLLDWVTDQAKQAVCLHSAIMEQAKKQTTQETSTRLCKLHNLQIPFVQNSFS